MGWTEFLGSYYPLLPKLAPRIVFFWGRTSKQVKRACVRECPDDDSKEMVVGAFGKQRAHSLLQTEVRTSSNKEWIHSISFAETEVANKKS